MEGGGAFTWRGVRTLSELGCREFGLLELTTLPSIRQEHWLPALNEADVLVVGGGNTPYLSSSRFRAIMSTMPRGLLVAVAVAVAAALAMPGRAAATYSVVATDAATRQVGGAVTSCVGNTNVAFVHGSAPGRGGINAQAAANTAGRDRAVVLLNMDVAPADIITMITAPSFDSNAASRQYGIADLAGRAAGFTGSSAQMYKEHRPGTMGTFTYSIQGNILTGRAVIDQAEAAFRGGGCDLADKLMLALEAGAQNGQGDSRCTGTRQIPSDSASIQVDMASGPVGSYLRLSLAGTGTRSPLVMLRTMFDAWRATHPCPTGATPDAGAIDSATTDGAGAGTGGAAAGTGGGANTGGRAGTAGQPGSAGRPGTGGQPGSAGGTNSGGQTSSGGGTGSGGQTGTGGQPASGGQTAAGGQTSTGGQGAPATGGRGGGNVAPDAGTDSDGSGGCGCLMADGNRPSALSFVALLTLGAWARRRSKKTQ